MTFASGKMEGMEYLGGRGRKGAMEGIPRPLGNLGRIGGMRGKSIYKIFITDMESIPPTISLKIL